MKLGSRRKELSSGVVCFDVERLDGSVLAEMMRKRMASEPLTIV